MDFGSLAGVDDLDPDLEAFDATEGAGLACTVTGLLRGDPCWLDAELESCCDADGGIPGELLEGATTTVETGERRVVALVVAVVLGAVVVMAALVLLLLLLACCCLVAADVVP